MHRLVDRTVTGAHYLRKPEISHASNQQPSNRRLQQLQPLRLLPQSRPQIPSDFAKSSAANPPMTPSTEYASSSRGSRNVIDGIRNMGCGPQNHRATATLATAARTMEPSTPAVHFPITSSITNRIAEIGALNAAARPAAAPTGANNRSFDRESPTRRPISEATPAPICNEGSSGPSDCPLPIASADRKNFPTTVRTEIYPLWMYSAAFV